MKKVGLFLAVICLVLAAGSVFGDEYTTKAKDPTSNPDSLINFLDPSNAPGVTVPAQEGLTEEGLPGARGSAAGGRSEFKDSMLNYLDPSYEPVERMQIKTAPEVKPIGPDSLIRQISPID